MPKEAHELSFPDSLDTTGLEDFFSCRDNARQTGLTLEETAKRLNISERTVQRRLKLRQLDGYKISGPRGPEWRILVESTEDTTLSTQVATLQASVSSEDTTLSTHDVSLQASVSSEDMTLSPNDATIVETLSSCDVPDNNTEEYFFKDEDSQSSPQTSNQSEHWHKQFYPTLEKLVSSLEKKDVVIESQAHQLKAASDVIMYMRSQLEEKDNQLKLLTDSQHKRGWWTHFGSWFVSKK